MVPRARSVAALLACALAACGGGPQTEDARAAAPVTAEPAASIAMPREGAELIGTAAARWDLDGWLDGAARALADLRGRAVLIRFFTNTCPFCAASMPALQQLHERRTGEGLAVLGFYHPKPYGAERSEESVRTLLSNWEVTFPVALDTGWRTLRRYWLDSAPDGGRRRATSVSFLLDGSGRIRYLHPGPELHPAGSACNLPHGACVQDFAALEHAIDVVLSEH